MAQLSNDPMGQLVALRKERGLSQDDLAGRLGVPQSRVSRMERSQRTTASELVAYAAALDFRLELVRVPA
jgi:transcriptional regulator with XRE-family HTH domain